MPEKKDYFGEPNNSNRPFLKFLERSRYVLTEGLKTGFIGGVGVTLPMLLFLNYQGAEIHQAATFSALVGIAANIEIRHQFVPRILDRAEEYLEHLLFH